jgi:hypothetical protein
MDWKLVDEQGDLLQMVNCQYDSLDISHWEYGAIEVSVDFKSKTTRIIRRDK